MAVQSRRGSVESAVGVPLTTFFNSFRSRAKPVWNHVNNYALASDPLPLGTLIYVATYMMSLDVAR